MLTDITIRRLAAREQRYSVLDAHGLYLEIMPTGKKYWRFRRVIDGRDVRRSLGVYPAVSLRDARLRRDEIIAAMAQGATVDAAMSDQDAASFSALAWDWFRAHVDGVRTPKYQEKIESRLRRQLLPYVGDSPAGDVGAADILAAARVAEERGLHDTAHRIVWTAGQIFRFGVASGRVPLDPTSGLRGALTPSRAIHHPAITDPEGIGALLRAMDGIRGSVIIRAALAFSVLVFCRPGEIRRAEWVEIDRSRAEWRIPAEKMKMRRVHIVPLSRQALAVLDGVTPFTGGSRYVFPSLRTFDRPMGDGSISAALRRMGYAQGEMTAHGFRSIIPFRSASLLKPSHAEFAPMPTPPSTHIAPCAK